MERQLRSVFFRTDAQLQPAGFRTDMDRHMEGSASFVACVFKVFAGPVIKFVGSGVDIVFARFVELAGDIIEKIILFAKLF